MEKLLARCPKCFNVAFQIFDDGVLCLGCGHKYEFQFMDDAKQICETRADDIVILINEGH